MPEHDHGAERRREHQPDGHEKQCRRERVRNNEQKGKKIERRKKPVIVTVRKPTRSAVPPPIKFPAIIAMSKTVSAVPARAPD